MRNVLGKVRSSQEQSSHSKAQLVALRADVDTHKHERLLGRTMYFEYDGLSAREISRCLSQACLCCARVSTALNRS
jgi:hypothetical protein